jgi:predicted nucleotidyltransferase
LPQHQTVAFSYQNRSFNPPIFLERPMSELAAGPHPDPHPIDPAIRADIEQRLTAIEAEHGVRVLFACESGSRGWGFASPDSDYDVRFIYVQPLSWYFHVSPQRDVIELPISDLLDINGWELRKALGLLKKGNATLAEWLDSPVVYRADAPFLAALRAAAGQTHRPERAFHHYVHMARKNHREYLRGDTVRLKKYLYVLRPLLATLWIEQGRGEVPMRFQALVDGLVTDPALRAAIEQLLAIKRAAPESEYGQPLPALNAFIETELARLASVLPPVTEDIDFSVLDRLLQDTVLSQPAPAGAA